jgi:glutamate synthase domain-containing protein 2
MTARQNFSLFIFTAPVVIFALSFVIPQILWLFVVLVPITVLGVSDMLQTKQSIKRLYPIWGRFRYLLESFRPEIQQYFVENETNGSPISREFRSLIYQRAKGARDTRPFGTIFDVNRAGYEWVNHSLQPKHLTDFAPRIKFGGQHCTKPYMASPLNISAMSYGALSKNAIMSSCH